MTPHRCPVCGGSGLVDNGFYDQTSGTWTTSDNTPETCKSCGGTGIVWEPQEVHHGPNLELPGIDRE